MSPAWNPLGVSLGLLLYIHMISEIGVENDTKGTIFFFVTLVTYLSGSTMLIIEFFLYVVNLYI